MFTISLPYPHPPPHLPSSKKPVPVDDCWPKMAALWTWLGWPQIMAFWFNISMIIYELLFPAEPNVRPWWHHISQFSRGFTTCFIRGSNHLAGMDGTLDVAPRHAYDTKFVHSSFHNNLQQQPFADFVWVRGKEGPFRARKHRLRANVRICAYNLISYLWLI